MAKHYHTVFGLDVSPGMPAQARKNNPQKKVNLVCFDGKRIDKAIAKGSINFLHSTLVFQHIRPRRGLRIIEMLLPLLAPQGNAYLQMPIHAENRVRYAINQIVTCHQPLILKTSRTLLRKKGVANDPVMQMNVYPVVRLLKLFQRNNVEVRYIETMEDKKNSLLHAGWYLARR